MTSNHTRTDGDDDDTPDPVIESNNIGDDIGTKVGEGHDAIEDQVL